MLSYGRRRKKGERLGRLGRLHTHETATISVHTVGGFEQCGELVSGPGANGQRVGERTVPGRNLRAETVVWDYDDEIEAGQVGDLGFGGALFASDDVTAAMENEDCFGMVSRKGCPHGAYISFFWVHTDWFRLFRAIG